MSVSSASLTLHLPQAGDAQFIAYPYRCIWFRCCSKVEVSRWFICLPPLTAVLHKVPVWSTLIGLQKWVFQYQRERLSLSLQTQHWLLTSVTEWPAWIVCCIFWICFQDSRPVTGTNSKLARKRNCVAMTKLKEGKKMY